MLRADAVPKPNRKAAQGAPVVRCRYCREACLARLGAPGYVNVCRECEERYPQEELEVECLRAGVGDEDGNDWVPVRGRVPESIVSLPVGNGVLRLSLTRRLASGIKMLAGRSQ